MVFLQWISIKWYYDWRIFRCQFRLPEGRFSMRVCISSLSSMDDSVSLMVSYFLWWLWQGLLQCGTCARLVSGNVSWHTGPVLYCFIAYICIYMLHCVTVYCSLQLYRLNHFFPRNQHCENQQEPTVGTSVWLQCDAMLHQPFHFPRAARLREALRNRNLGIFRWSV